MGVLQDGAENIDVTASGGPNWPRALAEMHALIAAEDYCQEHRLMVNGVPAVVSLDQRGLDLDVSENRGRAHPVPLR